MSQRAPLSSAKEPVWCVAARGVGTYISRVLMPKVTCCRKKKRKLVILKVTARVSQIHKPPSGHIRV